MGKNASGQTHYLSLSGLELYGAVSGVCEDQLGESCSIVLQVGGGAGEWVPAGVSGAVSRVFEDQLGERHSDMSQAGFRVGAYSCMMR